MKKIMSGVIFVCMPMCMLVAMENDRLKINLKLVDDCNKTYSIARWKVVQDSSQAEVLNIPGLTERSIISFDKELDEIDVQVVQKNDNALKLEIKKRIIGKAVDGKLLKGSHYSAYEAVFNYLLVSMIRDNIASNRVKGETAYPACGPIGKVGTSSARMSNDDGTSYVALRIPLSTMLCMSVNDMRDTSLVHVFLEKENDDIGDHIGVINYEEKNINSLSVTTDLKYLIATFDNKLTSNAALYSDEDYAAYKEIISNIKLADIYLLFHLYQAKKQGRQVALEKNEHEYVCDHVAKSEKGKELIKKHFLG